MFVHFTTRSRYAAVKKAKRSLLEWTLVSTRIIEDLRIRRGLRAFLAK
jgi:hypothetical protein